MIGELDFNGILLSPALVSGVLAFAGFVPLQWLMRRLRLHRIVWHAALFDAAVFLILWSAVAGLPLPLWSQP